jgi:superoxide dismutase, Cu-Zn family
MRSRFPLTVLSAAAMALSGCAGASPNSPGAGAPASWAFQGGSPGAPERTASGTFRRWSDDSTPPAVTYDPSVVPPGATADLEILPSARGMTVTLQVTGMIPGRSYGAHLHTSPCTATPAQAGPHYQNEHDPSAGPSKPSADPRYANPANEVWLDFTADASGTASAVADEDWTFSADYPPKSLIVHSEVTRTAMGVAGMAGPRVACLTLAGQ